MVWVLAETEDGAKRLTDKLKRKLHEFCPGPSVMEFIADTQGLGGATHLFLGLLPQWVSEFETVGRLWAYCGLHPVDGVAVRRHKGRRANWSSELKAIAIKRLAEPCMKMSGGENKNGRALPFSPYRATYDARRAHTLTTHPPMQDEGCNTCERSHLLWESRCSVHGAKRQARHQCEECDDVRRMRGKDCAGLGGIHWTDAHRHADALRITAKAILKDLWRVSRGHEPLFGGGDQNFGDTRPWHEPPTESAA
jgi:hypothetical protein